MLWTVVYEFFIKYIFGGYLYVEGEPVFYDAQIGVLFNPEGDYFENNTGYMNGISISDVYGETLNMPIGNYLSLLATIISLVVIVWLCCMLIKKIYNICAHVIG